MKKQEIVKKYLSDFPNLGSLTIAKKIYSDYPLIFKNVDCVRNTIRYYRGSNGKLKLKKITNDKFLTQENRLKKYNIPESIETEYKPFNLIGNKGIIFSDVHVPFHSVSSLETMFRYTDQMDLDFVLIAGDFMDCFMESKFCKDPTLIDFPKERDRTKALLKEIKSVYPKAKIYYKFGNHEKRHEMYMQEKANILYGMPEFRLEVLLDLYNMGIIYIPEDQYINLSGMSILHGHEYRGGITSPATPARTLYLRTKDSAIMGHYHQSSEHTESSINGKVITCWSIGCMCELHPKYMPLNKWNHSFAVYTREDEKFWTVQNKKIIEGRVV
jgi:predicted phosphodiesterase